MTETALVTGASAGIGRELARQFARRGHDVVLVARREERLRELAREFEDTYGVVAHVVVQDLASREGREALFEETESRGIAVTYLVNNVGMGTQGSFLDIDTERELTQLELNVVTPTHLTKLYGPGLRARNGGVLNVASSAAFQPGPYMAVYFASKRVILFALASPENAK
ncbi:SDR family NAD(P)-dependent oxidoreductase [Natronomonas sp. EA1]|uniref:SDR family NAD(P)-dependent oxidoreductase n=1 Tax=Natronomonas sp. EA1 TaxID=3421655 RepID=UPI003EBFAF51